MMKRIFMEEALRLARESALLGEVPVGAVVVIGDKIIGRGLNRREKGRNALYHAEIQAIDEACKRLGGWRLWECEMYVTLEPCPMCAGALAWSQIGSVVYGAADPKRGFSQFTPSLMHPKTKVVSGVLAEECGNLVTEFFRNK
jgi:tRNA(adenine34) deaminase